MPHRIVVMVGTRPEVIKMAPVVRELERRSGAFEPMLVTTAQHRDLLDQTLACFGLGTRADLALMTPDQRLPSFTGRAVPAVAELLDDLAPDAVLIHGDTTSAFATALAAFYMELPIGHVEAGLRSNQRESPFPEEMNRRLIGNLAELHFAPTTRARDNLLREGVPAGSIWITGNTVVDAMLEFRPDSAFDDARLDALTGDRRLLVVTAHRRETLGAPLTAICRALREITRRFPDTRIVFPVHPNPRVREVVCRELTSDPSIKLIDPVSYGDFLRLVHRSCLILTDSGGLQEEAPTLGKPVLVLRDTTERPELLEAGGGVLVGTDPRRIVRATAHLLRNVAAYDRMASAPNPFGDGRAASRIVDVLARRFGVGEPLEDTGSLALAAS